MSYNLPQKEIELRKQVDVANDYFFNNQIITGNVWETQDKEQFVEKVIFNGDYPKLLHNFVGTLYKKVDKHNLYNLAINLQGVKLEKINPFVWLVFDKSYGTYDFVNNTITYFNKNSIPHELLHLSSTINSLHSGFNIVKGKYSFADGFNEGYTEMLAQRIFFNEVFTNSAYKTDVYLLRIFELLYNDPKELESAYFNANYENPIKQFLNYGSLDEFKFILKHLDYFAKTDIWDDEENIVFDLLINKVEKTKEKCKIKKAHDIYNEYLLTENGKVR